MNRRADEVQRPWPAMALLGAVWAAGCLAPEAKGQDAASGVSPVKEARLAMEKWIEAEQLASREKQDWEMSRQILEDRARLIEREMKELAETGAEMRKKAGDVQEGNAKLEAERNSLDAAAAFLERRVPELERRIKGEVLPLLPDVLARKIEPLARRLPENPAAAKTELLVRFQNVVGILDAIEKFNRDVTVVREVRVLGGGKTAEVSTMYLGLGQAFYADPETGVAGRGIPGENGWKWEELPGAAEQIAGAIGMSERGKSAKSLPLPVKIQ